MKKSMVYSSRKKKSERIQLFIDTETKQHLYNAAEKTGTAASEIVRQALQKELKTQYKQYKKQNSE